jgi:hypothetical protein
MTSAVDEACGVPSPGPERSFYWEPALDTEAVLTSSSPDTRFHVFADGPLPCQPEACIVSGPTPLQLIADAQTKYTIVVDTLGNEADEAVEVTMLCALLEEDCANAVDDDNDGLTDCEDTVDCKLFGDCPMLELCDDGIDNDDDGYSDCKDVGCIGYASCVDQEACSDGIDNDGDGAADCEDTLCVVDPACQ